MSGVSLEGVRDLFGKSLANVTPVNNDVPIFSALLNAWIVAPSGAGGEANTSSNAGAGAGLALAKVGVDLPFKSLIATSPIIITVNANDLTLSILSNAFLKNIVEDVTPELGGQLDALQENIINVGDLTLSKTGSVRTLIIERPESVADNTVFGTLEFKSHNTVPLSVVFGSITQEFNNKTFLNEQGVMKFNVMSGGTVQTKLIIDGALNGIKIDKLLTVFDTGSSGILATDRPELGVALIGEHYARSFDGASSPNFVYTNVRSHVVNSGDGTEEGAWEVLVAEAGNAALSDARRYLACNVATSGLTEFFRNIDLKTNSILNAVIITPTIASFVNATHDHLSAAEGGTLGAGSVNELQLSASGRKEAMMIAVSGDTEVLSVGTGKITFRMPYAFTLTGVRASLTTAGTGAALVTVDINQGGTTILSTKITIDATEKTSTTAATPPVISDTTLNDDVEITVDIDVVDTDNVAAGLKIYLIGGRT